MVTRREFLIAACVAPAAMQVAPVLVPGGLSFNGINSQMLYLTSESFEVEIRTLKPSECLKKN